MVTETEAPPTLDAPSEPVTEAPSTGAEAVPSSQDEQQSAQDEPTTEQQDEPSDPTQAALDKRAAIRKGDESLSLTAKELRTLEDYDRAENNRRIAWEQQETTRKANVERLAKAYDEAKPKLRAAAVGTIKALLDNPNVELNEVQQAYLERSLDPLIDGLRAEAEATVIEPLLESRRDAILNAYRTSNALTPDIERTVKGLKRSEDVDTFMVNMATEYGRWLGQQDAAGKDHVLVPKKEYERLTKADALDQNAGKVNARGATMGSAGRGGGLPKLTLDQIDKMPTSEWMSLGDAKTRQEILDDARRSGR